MTDIPQDDDPSVHFSAMAQRIIHNAGGEFGGAAVIISPGGIQIEVLMLGAGSDEAQFLSTIKTRIDIKLAEVDEKQRNQTAFGRVR
jgi:hypothetical protein